MTVTIVQESIFICCRRSEVNLGQQSSLISSVIFSTWQELSHNSSKAPRALNLPATDHFNGGRKKNAQLFISLRVCGSMDWPAFIVNPCTRFSLTVCCLVGTFVNFLNCVSTSQQFYCCGPQCMSVGYTGTGLMGSGYTSQALLGTWVRGPDLFIVCYFLLDPPRHF